MERFEELKQELLKRAKNAGACKEQYARAYKAGTLAQLMKVCGDNFQWACDNEVLNVDIITQYHDEFAVGLIYANEDVTQGYLLCGNASVKAYGNASVVACDKASVEAYCDASVEAYDNASVKAYDNASVKAHDNAYITSFFTIEVKLFDNATYRIRENNTIRYANPEIKFELVE